MSLRDAEENKKYHRKYYLNNKESIRAKGTGKECPHQKVDVACVLRGIAC